MATNAPAHGTPFRRAPEEGLIDKAHPIRVGTRSGICASTEKDREAGFQLVSAMDFEDIGAAGAGERIRQRVCDAPVYISVDIDVLDPAHASGTGTPATGGLSSREPLGLRRLVGTNVVGADVVEVAPAYDHAEVTAIAAAHVIRRVPSALSRGTRFSHTVFADEGNDQTHDHDRTEQAG